MTQDPPQRVLVLSAIDRFHSFQYTFNQVVQKKAHFICGIDVGEKINSAYC